MTVLNWLVGGVIYWDGKTWRLGEAFKSCFLHVEFEMGNDMQINMLNWICESRTRREIRDINLGVINV